MGKRKTTGAQKPVRNLVTYHPKKGGEAKLEELVLAHWPALHEIGLVTSTPSKVWRATDKRTGALSFVEEFEWIDDKASRTAHETPEVMRIWEPMVIVLENLVLQTIEPLDGARPAQKGKRSLG